MVKDPLIPAEGCPWAFNLHLFNCQLQITLFPVSPSVPLSALCSGSSSIPSLCSPLWPNSCRSSRKDLHPTSAGFSQSQLSVAGSGLQTQLFSKGNISPDTFWWILPFPESHYIRDLRGAGSSLPFLSLFPVSELPAPFTGDSLQMLFLKVTKFLPSALGDQQSS